MLEALICAAGMALSAPDIKKSAAQPPAELLEFLADWREDEAHQFLDARERGDKPLPALGAAQGQGKDIHHEH